MKMLCSCEEALADIGRRSLMKASMLVVPERSMVRASKT